MNVAVVHYHLADGGVAEVIRRTVPAMAGTGVRQMVFTGGAAPDTGWHRRVDGLGYGAPEFVADLLMERVIAAARDAFGCEPDLWHFHNHSLGKNPLLPALVARLATAGEQLLLHIHDLAEDGRPENARNLGDRSRLYPLRPNVHYAFLNSRDRDLFVRAGLPSERAHLLPNPIAARPIPPGERRTPLMLAPVRGIRRKNLGEMVLLARLAPSVAMAGASGSGSEKLAAVAGASGSGAVNVAVTRAPLDPVARIIHDGWQRFAEEAGIPIRFDVVDRISAPSGAGGTGHCSFEDWLAASTHILTTSVSEGFGLPFLEAAAWRRPLIGRRLPHVSPDGGDLYDRLLVPAEWIGTEMLERILDRSVRYLHSAWGLETPPDVCGKILAVLRHGEFLDFGNLPEILQREVILRANDPESAARIMVRYGNRIEPVGAWLARVLNNREPNAAVSLPESCRPEVHRERLVAIYRKLHSAAPADTGGFLDAGRILNVCLAPENFRFLTTSPTPSARAGGLRAIVFDVYGTLLAGPAGGVRADPDADARLREVIRSHGHEPPLSPSALLHDAVRRHHHAAGIPYPEVDLRELWREVLSLPREHDTTALVIDTEAAWHLARPMPGVRTIVTRLAGLGIPLGLLSNAQCNTLHDLGSLAACFEPDLTVLSYRHGMAKPSPGLFQLLVVRLAARGILPAETLYVGNDPLQDITPAAAAGMRTALFTGHPDSLRPGDCDPDCLMKDWSQLAAIAEDAK